MHHPTNLHHQFAAVEIERTRIRLLGRCDWLAHMVEQLVGSPQELCQHPSATDEFHHREPEPRGISLLRAAMEQLRYEPDGTSSVLRQQGATGTEKRSHEGQAFQQPVCVVPLDVDGRANWSAAYLAVARNLSPDGVALLQGRRPWTERILLGLPAAGEPFYQAATVRYARPLGDAMMELGCHSPGWPCIPTARLPQRRREQRSAYTGCVDLLSLSGQAVGRDLSKSGLAFITHGPLCVGEYVLSLPRQAGPPLRLLSDVIRCREVAAGFYDVGARIRRLDQQA